jgi:putative ABC transport system permease protein
LILRLPDSQEDPHPDGRSGPAFRPSLMASASLFRLIGATAMLGRLPDERDEAPGATPVAVLSRSTWTSLYGSDVNVIGRTLVRYLSGGRKKSVTIVGVLATDAFVRLWLPQDGPGPPAVSSLDADAMRFRDDAGRERWTPQCSVYARLAPGVTLDAARAELTALTPHLAQNVPATNASEKPLLRGNRLRDEVIADVRAPLIAFLCAVVGLLVVA